MPRVGLELSLKTLGKRAPKGKEEPKWVPSCVKPGDWAKLPAAVKLFIRALIDAARSDGR